MQTYEMLRHIGRLGGLIACSTVLCAQAWAQQQQPCPAQVLQSLEGQGPHELHGLRQSVAHNQRLSAACIDELKARRLSQREREALRRVVRKQHGASQAAAPAAALPPEAAASVASEPDAAAHPGDRDAHEGVQLVGQAPLLRVRWP